MKETKVDILCDVCKERGVSHYDIRLGHRAGEVRCLDLCEKHDAQFRRFLKHSTASRRATTPQGVEAIDPDLLPELA